MTRFRFSPKPLAWWLVPCLVSLVAGQTGTTLGQTIEPLPEYAQATALREDASLHAIAFGNQSVGLAVGDRGTILRSDDGGGHWRSQASRVTCNLSDVRWINDQRVIAIGGAYDRITGISRGVVLVSSDAGQTWQRGADEELPRLRHFLRTDDGKRIRAAGDFSHAALSNQFESRDGGQTWQAVGEPDEQSAFAPSASSTELRKWTEVTSAHVPIRGATRTGRASVWAVGDHGVILQSDDGGRSWQNRRGPGRQSSVLIVSASAEGVAWPVLGSETLESSNRVAVLVDDPRLTPPQLDRLRQAAVMLGGASADTISSTAVEQAAADWIAIQQPLVLVMDKHLRSETRDAFSRAAIAGGVARIVTYGHDSRTDTTLHRGALLPRQGVLISDLWNDALQLVAPNKLVPPSLGLTRVYEAAGNSTRGDSLTTGLRLAPGRRLAANLEPASRRQLQIAQARMGQPRRVNELITASRSVSDFKSKLGAMLDQTSKADQFRLAWSILIQVSRPQRSSETGNVGWQQAVLQEFTERFSATSAGKLTQLQLYAGQHSRERSQLGAVVSRPVERTAAPAVPVSPFQVERNAVQQATALSPIVIPETKLIELTPTADSEADVDLMWEFHPLVLVAREAAKHRGDDNKLQAADGPSANLERLTSSLAAGPWSRLLRSGSSSVIVARRAESPPRLDGDLSDPCWASALSHAGRTVTIRVAYDDEHVYVAMSCPAEMMAVDTTPRDSAEIRDHDLTGADRLQLRIDTDLDLLTSMQLEVSETGRYDAIDGHPQWQPTWYVASHRGRKQIHMEMAIIRRDLTDLPIHRGNRWFMSGDLLTAGKATGWEPMPDPNDWLQVVFR